MLARVGVFFVLTWMAVWLLLLASSKLNRSNFRVILYKGLRALFCTIAAVVITCTIVYLF